MTIQIAREEIHCCHMGYYFWLTARVLLYSPSHRQDSTYHDLCYTSCGALAGTRNSSTPWRIDPTTHRTMSERSYYGATSCSSEQNKPTNQNTVVKSFFIFICHLCFWTRCLFLILYSSFTNVTKPVSVLYMTNRTTSPQSPPMPMWIILPNSPLSQQNVVCEKRRRKHHY